MQKRDLERMCLDCRHAAAGRLGQGKEIPDLPTLTGPEGKGLALSTLWFLGKNNTREFHSSMALLPWAAVARTHGWLHTEEGFGTAMPASHSV